MTPVAEPVITRQDTAASLSPRLRRMVESALSWEEGAAFFDPDIAPSANSEALLARWKKLVTMRSNSEAAFPSRLVELGWSEPVALAHLAPVSLPDSAALPEWAILLRDLLEPAEEHTLTSADLAEATELCRAAIDLRRIEFPSPEEDRPVFLALLLPFLASALREMRSLPNLGLCLANSAQQDLLGALLRRLSWLSVRTVAHEMKLARSRGTLWSATPEERYLSFIDEILPSQRVALFEQYPVLARMLATVTLHFRRCTDEFVLRLYKDRERLRDLTGGDGAILPALRATPFLSDPHNGGQTVWRVTLANAAHPDRSTVFYKPRSLAVDLAWSALLDWVRIRGLEPHLVAAPALNFDLYGWSLGVSAFDCADEAEIALYFRRQGVCSALITMLGGQDFHAENFIAAGSMPVAVDLEGLLAAAVSARLGPLADVPLAAQPLQYTGAGNLMLPYFRAGDADQPLFCSSGIAGSGARPWPRKAPQWAAKNTDQLHLEFAHHEFRFDDSVPTLAGSKVDAASYREEIATAIADTFRFLQQHRDALLAPDGPLAAFRGVESRTLFRDTQEYADLLFWTTAPDLLQSGAAYDVALEILAGKPPVFGNGTNFPALLEEEKRCLWQRDIPIAITGNTTTDLSLPGGASFGPIVPLSAWDQLSHRLEHWTADEPEWQGGVARALLALTIERPLPGNHDFIRAAVEIGDALAESAICFADEVSWMGMLRGAGTDRVYPAQANAWDLNGNAGAALFLAELARVANRPDLGDLARRALLSAHRTLRDLRRTDLKSLVGLSSFHGGYALVYAFTRAAVALGDPSLLDHAVEVALDHHLDELRAESNPDFLTGLAGTLATLALLHQHRPDQRLADQAEVCADRIAHASIDDGRAGWKVHFFDRPLLGMAHGSSGVATALLVSQPILGRPAADVVLRAFDHERLHFNAAHGRWPNLQRTDEHYMHGWCAGPAGFGMARISALRLGGDRLRSADVAIREDLEVSIRGALADLHTAGQHACCGDAGTLIFLASAARALGRPELLEAARTGARLMLQKATERGSWRLQEFTERMPLCGLMSGVSGIGMALLHLVDPQCSEFLTLC